MRYNYFLECNKQNDNKKICHINSRTIKNNTVDITINNVKETVEIECLLSLVCIYKTHYVENPKVLENWDKWGKAQWLKVSIDFINEKLDGKFRIGTKEEARKVDYEDWFTWYGNKKKGPKYKEHIGQIAIDTNVEVGKLGKMIAISNLLGLGYMMKNMKWADDETNVLLGLID